MESAANTLVILVTLSGLRLLGASRLASCIRTVAFQGIVLGILALVGGDEPLTVHSVLLVAASVGLKGVVFPWLLLRALKKADVHREVEPIVGFSASILLGIVFIGISLWASWKLPLPSGQGAALLVPVAFFTILVGLFLIITRRKALTQVIGYLAMENGIYALGLAFALKQPLLVELGILLDAFMAVFVMGIAIFHISREFDHMDADQLAALRD